MRSCISWEARPRAPGALAAQTPPSRAADGAHRTVCTGHSVHGRIHALPWRSPDASYRTSPPPGRSAHTRAQWRRAARGELTLPTAEPLDLAQHESSGGYTRNVTRPPPSGRWLAAASTVHSSQFIDSRRILRRARCGGYDDRPTACSSQRLSTRRSACSPNRRAAVSRWSWPSAPAASDCRCPSAACVRRIELSRAMVARLRGKPGVRLSA